MRLSTAVFALLLNASASAVTFSLRVHSQACHVLVFALFAVTACRFQTGQFAFSTVS